MEGEKFPKVDPSELLAARFSTLWYMNDMAKEWQSNAMFHAYYLQLKCAIEAFPRMTPNTLHQYRLLAKFCADRHFIYITACRDESKEELQSYYKLIDEDMEEITKEWPAKFLTPVEDAELSDPDIMGSPLVTLVKHDGQKKNKRMEDVQNIESDEEDNSSKESRPDSPAGGGGDKVNQEEEGEEGENKDKGEVTPLKDPLTEVETSKKRKVSLQKTLARKKTLTNKPHQRMCSQWMMSISSSQS
jgi:hypothetical protein